MWNELRYTFKLLVKNIRYSMLCMSVIAIGLGIVLPFYAMIDNSLYKTPQIEQGERFVTFRKDPSNQRLFGLSLYDNFHYAYFRDNAKSFQTIKAWRDASITISDGEYPEVYRSAEIEPDLLAETGVQALLGRIFLPEDVLPGAPPVALISYAVWQNYYAGREDIIGHQARINSVARTIVGVLPEDYEFPVNHHLWLPLAVPASVNVSEGPENLLVIGILEDEVGIEDASREIQILQAQIKANWPGQYDHIAGSRILPYILIVSGEVGANELAILLASVMLMVIFNVGNLFVARGEERVYELAIRGALGAPPWKMVLALMLESLLICIGGLLAGLLLGYFGIGFIGQLIPGTNSSAAAGFWWDMRLDYRMIAVSSLITFVVWLVGGGLPAWRMSRKNFNDLLSSGGKGMNHKSSTRLNGILVNVQLVIGCGLLTLGTTITFMDSGETMTVIRNSGSLYTGSIIMGASYQGDAEAQRNFRAELTQMLAREDGVQGSAYTTAIPGNAATQLPYTVENEDLAVNGIYPRQFTVSVSDNYFELLDIEMVQGRSFAASDSADSLPVAIVDQRLVENLWSGETAIGKRIQINPGDTAQWLTIVGVSAPSRHEPVYVEGQAGVPVLYRPLGQANAERFQVVVKSENPGFAYTEALRNAVARVDRDIPVSEISSIAQDEMEREDTQEINMYISYAFILIAVYLSSFAMYGLAARATALRRVETGIRMALGADKAAALRVFLKDGIKTIAAGLSLGGVLAIVVAYFIMSENAVNGFDMLIQVTVLICVIMGSLVMLANYLPAKKIIAMEPGDALRHE